MKENFDMTPLAIKCCIIIHLLLVQLTQAFNVFELWHLRKSSRLFIRKGREDTGTIYLQGTRTVQSIVYFPL